MSSIYVRVCDIELCDIISDTCFIETKWLYGCHLCDESSQYMPGGLSVCVGGLKGIVGI